MGVKRYRIGEMATSLKKRPAVWSNDLNRTYDLLSPGEVVMVVQDEDDSGWVRVVTRRGIAGLVHRTNLTQLCSVEES